MYLVKDNWSYLTICKSKPSNNAQKNISEQGKNVAKKSKRETGVLVQVFQYEEKMYYGIENNECNSCK